MSRTTVTQQWCVHCDLEQTRRRNGLCGACNAYEHKYGIRPSSEVISKRLHRREQARFEAMLDARRRAS